MTCTKLTDEDFLKRLDRLYDLMRAVDDKHRSYDGASDEAHDLAKAERELWTDLQK